MATEVSLPYCFLECYQYLYPKIDFTKIHFYDGIPDPFGWGSEAAITLTWGYGSDIHIYTKEGTWLPCDQSGPGYSLFLTLAHELVHVLQIMNLPYPSEWLPRYVWRFMGSGGKSDCNNNLEREAYYHANGCPDGSRPGDIESCTSKWAGNHSPCTCSGSEPEVMAWTMFGKETFLDKLKTECGPSLVLEKSHAFTSTNIITVIVSGFFSVFGAPTSSSAGFWGGVSGATIGAVVGGFLGAAFGPLGIIVGALVGALVGWVIGGLLGTLGNWFGGLFGGASNLLMKEYVGPDGSGATNLGGYTAQSSPFVAADGFVYFQGTDDTLWKVNTQDGTGASLGGYKTNTAPVAGNDGYAYFQGTDDTLWRVDVTTGSGAKVGGYKTKGTPCVPGDGYIYFQGTDDKLWKVPTSGSGGVNLGGYKASSTPWVAADGYVYFQGTDDTLWRVDVTTGSGAKVGGYKTKGTPCVPGDGYIYFQGTDDKLWKVPTSGSGGVNLGGYTASSTPWVAADGYVYFQGTDDTLWKILSDDGSQGAPVPGAKIGSAPSVPGDGFAYFQAN